MGSVTKMKTLVLATAAALIAAPTASADGTPPPPGTPSIGQYVETVPTAQGGSAAGVGNTHAKKLPRKIAKRLRETKDPVTERLSTIATSSAYGAPQTQLRETSRQAAQNRGQRNTTPTQRVAAPPQHGAAKAASPLSAAVTAVSGSSDSHVFWLLGAVIAVTAAMILSVRRRRSI